MGALRTFPVSMVVAGRRVAVVGNGEAAAAKLRLLAKTQAEVHLYATAQGVAMQEAALHGYAVRTRLPEIAELNGAAIAFIATEDDTLDRELVARARNSGVPVNVVDRPELCDLLTPAFVDRAPVTIAISTEGAAPVLAGILRARIEILLAPGLGRLALLAGSMRGRVAELLPGGRRLAFWRAFFSSHEIADASTRRPAQARRRAMQLLKGWERGASAHGAVWFVGAGPGASDLLTLRGHRVLAEADVVIHDRSVDAGMLDHVRRDARRIVLHEDDRVPDLFRALLDEARRGQRVVRLLPGDPSSRSGVGDTIAALRRAGIVASIVPGIVGTASDEAAQTSTPPILEDAA